jgi:hypothetical protein
VCPYYLDGDLDTKASRGKPARSRVGDTQLLWLIDATWERGVMVCCAVLKVREEAFARQPDRVALRSTARADARSLKTQQHAGASERARRAPGPVDVPRSRRERSRLAVCEAVGTAGIRNRCSLERR